MGEPNVREKTAEKLVNHVKVLGTQKKVRYLQKTRGKQKRGRAGFSAKKEERWISMGTSFVARKPEKRHAPLIEGETRGNKTTTLIPFRDILSGGKTGGKKLKKRGGTGIVNDLG